MLFSNIQIALYHFINGAKEFQKEMTDFFSSYVPSSSDHDGPYLLAKLVHIKSNKVVVAPSLQKQSPQMDLAIKASNLLNGIQALITSLTKTSILSNSSFPKKAEHAFLKQSILDLTKQIEDIFSQTLYPCTCEQEKDLQHWHQKFSQDCRLALSRLAPKT
jgi:hypothetical protein